MWRAFCEASFLYVPISTGAYGAYHYGRRSYENDIISNYKDDEVVLRIVGNMFVGGLAGAFGGLLWPVFVPTYAFVKYKRNKS